MVGFAIFGGAVFDWALLGRDNRYLYGVLGIILALYGVRTVDRNGDWYNDVTLFLAAVEDGNRSAKVYYNLGVGYRKQQKYDEAIDTFQKVVDLKPRFARGWDALYKAYAHKSAVTEGEEAREAAKKAEEALNMATALQGGE